MAGIAAHGDTVYWTELGAPRIHEARDEVGRAFERVLEAPSGFPFCDDENFMRSFLLEGFPASAVHRTGTAER